MRLPLLGFPAELMHGNRPCRDVCDHLLIHREAYLKGAKLFQIHSDPGFMLEELTLVKCTVWPLLLQSLLGFGKQQKCPPKAMEGEDPAAPPSAPYRNISNAPLGFLSLFRVVQLTPLNNHLHTSLLCLQSRSQTRCKLP